MRVFQSMKPTRDRDFSFNKRRSERKKKEKGRKKKTDENQQMNEGC